MAELVRDYTVKDGRWNDRTVWHSGTVPTADTWAEIWHHITISASDYHTGVVAGMIELADDNAVLESDLQYYDEPVVMTVGEFRLRGGLANDTCKIHLGDVLLKVATPGILNDEFYNVKQDEARNVIITDPGYIGASAKLQDIQPEGSARAYARKISNGVRYLTVTVRIRSSMPHLLGRLYRMAASSQHVLLVTDRSVLKGFIETIAPDQSAVGTEYISVKVTVAEGS